MRVQMIEGVTAFSTHHASDDRGFSLQLAKPAWTSSRFYAVHNPKAFTLRGLHFQLPGAWKLVTCIHGAVFDVLVDLRQHSPTFQQWTELCLCPGDAVQIPPGVAHGYLTLTPNTTLAYILEGARNDDLGVRWDDPKVGIIWPSPPNVISERDRTWGDL